MNQRIQELVEQTGFTDSDLAHGRDEMLAEFAKLIVRECAGVCDLYAMPDGTSETAMVLSAAIKRKFGVEE